MRHTYGKVTQTEKTTRLYIHINQGGIIAIALALAVIVLASIVVMNLTKGTAQSLRDLLAVNMAAANIRKVGNLASHCTAQFKVDRSIFSTCMEIINSFNQHMAQFNEEQKDNIAKVFVGNIGSTSSSNSTDNNGSFDSSSSNTNSSNG